MNRRWIAFFVCLSELVFAGAARAEGATPFAGTWRTTGADTLHVRVADDGRIDTFHPRTGRRASATPVPFGNGKRGITALLPNLEVVSVGPVAGGIAMSVGGQLFALTPMTDSEFERRAAPPPPEAPARPVGADPGAGALRGMRLSAAQGSLGNYRDLYLYDFCSDGSFRYETMTTGQGVASQRTDGGRWTMGAGGREVVLHWRSGASRSLPLRRVESDVLQMDGRKYVVERSGVCR